MGVRGRGQACAGLTTTPGGGYNKARGVALRALAYAPVRADGYLGWEVGWVGWGYLGLSLTHIEIFISEDIMSKPCGGLKG